MRTELKVLTKKALLEEELSDLFGHEKRGVVSQGYAAIHVCDTLSSHLMVKVVHHC